MPRARSVPGPLPSAVCIAPEPSVAVMCSSVLYVAACKPAVAGCRNPRSRGLSKLAVAGAQ